MLTAGGDAMKKRAAISEAAGCSVIYLTAVFLHFVYTLSGGAALGIVFGAVNESVWEHCKIFTAAYIFYSLLQLSWLRLPFRRYVVAKVAGLYLLMGIMIGFFYTYTYFTGRSIPAVDILSSAVTVVNAQLVTWLLETGRCRIEEFFVPALLLLFLYYLMFFSFTVFPPKTDLFRDPISGGYGIRGFFRPFFAFILAGKQILQSRVI